MTTTVTVKALHGWPVKVTQTNPETGERGHETIVQAGAEHDFYVHSAADLLVHEIQPDEDGATAA